MHYRRVQRHGTPDRLVEPGRKICTVDGCDKFVDAHGLCHGHYQRKLRKGDVKEGEPLSKNKNTGVCIVEGCTQPQRTKQLCKTHYNRTIKFGDVRADLPLGSRPGNGGFSHGYWKVPVPKDLRHLTNGQTPVGEHRLVMAQMLGRPLFPDESVHHKNGDRCDNRPENLELWSRWQPSGQRIEDKVTWALEVLRRYRPDLTSDLSDCLDPQ